MRNSFSNSGVSNSQGSGPASRTITGARLGGEHWWWLV